MRLPELAAQYFFGFGDFPEVARLRHADCIGQCPLSGAPRKTFAHIELPQHDGTAVIMTHDVERVFADIDADHGDRCVEFLRHGVLLVLSAPRQLLVLAGPEHGRTILLTDIAMCQRNVWHRH